MTEITLDEKEFEAKLVEAREEGWRDATEMEKINRKLVPLISQLENCGAGIQWHCLSEIHSVLRYSFNTLREAYALHERFSGKYPQSLEAEFSQQVRWCEAAHSELSGAYHQMKKQSKKGEAA